MSGENERKYCTLSAYQRWETKHFRFILGRHPAFQRQVKAKVEAEFFFLNLNLNLNLNLRYAWAVEVAPILRLPSVPGAYL